MKLDRNILKNEIDRVSSEWETSGGVVVIKEGEILYEGICGYEDRESLLPITKDTRYVFHTESSFLLGLCTFILIDQGKIKLNDSLSKFIPEYKHGSQIKIKHLLQFCSGMSDFFYNHLMIELNNDEKHSSLSDHDRERIEKKTFNMNRDFSTVLSIVEDVELLYEPGTAGRGGSSTDWAFLAEVIRRISKKSIFEFLAQYVFEPLSMSDIEAGCRTSAVSCVEMKEVELVRIPLDYPVEGLFTMTLEDMKKLLHAIGSRKIFSDKIWERALKYNSEGIGLIFENANGFDCGTMSFLGFGFYFYFNHKSGVSYASIVTEEQKFKYIDNDWYYYRRDLREVIESAFTFPQNTCMKKLNKENMWQTLNLKVGPEQNGFVLEAKSSVAMALMYKTKHAFVEMEENRVIGLLVLDIDQKKAYYNIDIILIDKRYQGRGYGKFMLNWAIDYLSKAGANELEIGVNRFNHAAKKIYLDAGFTPKAVYDGGMTLHMKLKA